MNAIKRSIVIGSLCCFVLLSIFGLLVMNYVHTHTHHTTSNCPFMVGQQALCAMDTIDHIAAWQASSAATVVAWFVFLVPAVFFIYRLLTISSTRKRQYHKKPLFELLFTQLFSSGILHSKAY